MIAALTLRECLDFLGSEATTCTGSPELKLTGIACDSRRVGPGMLFCALPGTSDDGLAFLPDAVRRGCAAVLTEKPEQAESTGLPILAVANARKAAAMLEDFWRGCPSRKLELFGVTGTNGKTTTAYALAAALGGAAPCGLLSTIETRDGGSVEPSRWTTPAPEILFDYFDRMARNGCRRAAMELSSHALSQYRTGDARFACAIFTNLTGDHLDYHKDMEHYYQAKKRLFTECVADDGLAVIHLDASGFGERLARELAVERPELRLRTFGETAAADEPLRIEQMGLSGSTFRLGETLCRTNLAGRHNVENAAGVVLAARFAAVPEENLQSALTHLSVPGRLERCDVGGRIVFIDYAHTDDALKNVLSFLRSATRNRLIAVFGAGGDRDRTKRPRMGRVVSELADLAIITSDNPRSEAPESIIDEIASGCSGARATVLKEPDRAEAIALALREAAPEDVVLIAGKGHEDYQEIRGVKHHFSDRETVRKLGSAMFGEV